MFEQFSLKNAYVTKEADFKITVRVFKRTSARRDANVISSRVLHKVNPNDNAYLKLKVQITPHRNEESEKKLIRTER